MSASVPTPAPPPPPPAALVPGSLLAGPFGVEVDRAIQADAIKRYPYEACGAVVDEGGGPLYRPLLNMAGPNNAAAPDPTQGFDCSHEVGQLLVAGTLRCVAHSHPGGPLHPSAADMAAQGGFDLPWAMVATDGERASTPLYWGPGVPVPPLVGRPFRHGPSGSDGAGDCFALVRDWYRLERGVELPESPRDWEWWQGKVAASRDLYRDGFGQAGFRRVPRDDPQVGDVILMQLATPLSNPVPNHSGICLGGGLMLHHLTGRLSRTEPYGRWMKHVVEWLRHADA